MTSSEFNSYSDFALFFKKARSKPAGRPVRGWCRLYQVEDDYVLKLVGWRGADNPLCRIHPDNTVTFVGSVEDVLGHKQTLVASMWKVIPFYFERYRKDLYRIDGAYVADRQEDSRWDWMRKKAPQYFQGIRFDLLTGECLNAQPDLAQTIIPEVRKEWLRDLRRFKRGLKTRAKVGALRIVAETVHAERGKKYVNTAHVWFAPELVTELVRCMREEDYPPHLLRAFVYSTPMGWRQATISDQDILENVDRVFNAHSTEFRKAYGVFGETLHVKL